MEEAVKHLLSDACLDFVMKGTEVEVVRRAGKYGREIVGAVWEYQCTGIEEAEGKVDAGDGSASIGGSFGSARVFGHAISAV